MAFPDYQLAMLTAIVMNVFWLVAYREADPFFKQSTNDLQFLCNLLVIFAAVALFGADFETTNEAYNEGIKIVLFTNATAVLAFCFVPNTTNAVTKRVVAKVAPSTARLGSSARAASSRRGSRGPGSPGESPGGSARGASSSRIGGPGDSHIGGSAKTDSGASAQQQPSPSQRTAPASPLFGER
jgi:hypothetical protein